MSFVAERLSTAAGRRQMKTTWVSLYAAPSAEAYGSGRKSTVTPFPVPPFPVFFPGLSHHWIMRDVAIGTGGPGRAIVSHTGALLRTSPPEDPDDQHGCGE